VIIPAYNEEAFIENTLQSIENQNYPSLEVIVVDNGSNDSTANIAKKYNVTVVIYNKKHRASIARNVGALKATGNYLAFLDADSCLSPNSISSLIKYIDSGYSGGTCRVLPPEDNLIAICQTLIVNKWPRKIGPMYTPFVITSKENFKKIGGWNENLGFAEEIDFQRKLSRLGRLKLDLDSYVSTSPRRYQKKGYIRTTFYGVLGYIGYNTRWEPIR
jgi:glycosyltransferase involved in cell wall biosynthesis